MYGAIDREMGGGGGFKIRGEFWSKYLSLRTNDQGRFFSRPNFLFLVIDLHQGQSWAIDKETASHT